MSISRCRQRKKSGGHQSYSDGLHPAGDMIHLIVDIFQLGPKWWTNTAISIATLVIWLKKQHKTSYLLTLPLSYSKWRHQQKMEN